jgi:hypothetical protein
MAVSTQLPPFRPEHCRVELERRFENAQGFVFLIPQAVGRVSFEKRMVETLRHCLDLTGAKLVCAESGAGDIDPASRLAHIPTDNMTAVANEWLGNGQLHAPEYLLLIRDRQFAYWGVEDMGLYHQTVEQMRPLIRTRKEWQGVFQDLSDQLRQRPAAEISAELVALSQSQATPSGDFGNRLDTLLDHASRLNVNWSSYRQLQRLQASRRLEAAIDFEAANIELRTFVMTAMEWLKDPYKLLQNSPALCLEALPVSSTQEWLAIVQQFPGSSLARLMNWYQEGYPVAQVELVDTTPWHFLQRATYEVESQFVALLTAHQNDQVGENALAAFGLADLAFYDFVIDLVVLLDVDLASVANLVRYVQYRRRVGMLDLADVVREIASFEVRIMKRLCSSQADHDYVLAATTLAGLNDLLSLTAVNDQLAELSEISPTGAKLARLLKPLLACDDVVRTFEARSQEFDQDYRRAMVYYGLMSARADCLAKGTVARLRDEALECCLLLVGGFHVPTICATLSQLHVSHAVLMPFVPPEEPSSEQYWEIIYKQ